MFPAFTSAHSHAFQIGLRGCGERFPSGAADFWSWRQAMYGLVEQMDPDVAYQLAHRCYREMVQAGIQTVGEFHYLRHHVTDQLDFVLDQAVIQAAHDAGIELVLLPAAYEEGGPGMDLSTAQQRFVSGGFRRYWERFDQLQGMLRSGKSMQACVHSLRAVRVRARQVILHVRVEHPHAPELGALLEDHRVVALARELARGGEAGGARADHGDARASAPVDDALDRLLARGRHHARETRARARRERGERGAASPRERRSARDRARRRQERPRGTGAKRTCARQHRCAARRPL